MSINKVIATGNLTRDPELKALPSGTQILNFSIAINERRKNQQTGQYEDYANFVDCAMFGARAEALAKFLRKGAKVAIEGRLHYSYWQAQDGSKRTKLDVYVDELDMMQSRAQATQQGSVPAQAPAASYSNVNLPF